MNIKLKIRLKRPKAFDIKETDTIEKIEEMQAALKRYMIDLQKIYQAIEEFKQEKKLRSGKHTRSLTL